MPPRTLHAWVARIVVLAVLLLLGHAQAAAQARKELRVGVAELPAALDPADALEGAVPLVARHVLDTLVSYRRTSTDVEPGLAVSWSVSRDGLTWTFVLRDGVRFHDGTPLTAEEVAASFRRQLDPAATGAVWPALLRGRPGVVREVRAVDARTVQFVLAQPYAPLVNVLAHPGLGVGRVFGAADGVPRLVGSGPYRVVDLAPGRVAIEAVPGHWAGPVRMQRILFLEVPGDAEAEAALDSGSLDIWFPAAAPRRLDGALSVPGLRIGYLSFQTEKEPFSRKKIRHAVAAALDPAVIDAALGDVAVPLPSFLPPGVWGRREGSPILGGTRETVKTLLAQGGWPAGYKPTLLVPNDMAPVDGSRLVKTLVAALAAADIPVEVRVEPMDRVRAMLQAGEHELALVESAVLAGDPHLLLFPLSTSEGASKGPKALNFSFYRNPRLDDVLIRASQLGFRPERARLYQRAQGLLADELPWLPVYVRLVWGVARAEVQDLRLHPTGFHRLTTVGLGPASP
ncbi:MAG TPA: ABC transporter substrate-binding protein [Candidatus Tectomicrobia bacterium]|nr:ABC transporter substrate-binding protein [Candidatus Tectomicrobia bacterium]